MTESKRDIKTDLARLDAHIVQPDELEDIPELTDAFFEEADHYIGEKLIRRGRPKAVLTKALVSLRIDRDILESFRASGPGWQSRINQALRAAVAKGEIRR